MPHISKEDIADRITELLIEHFTAYGEYDPDLTLSYFQKVVRDGQVQVATSPPRTDDERLVLYQSDVKGNEADIDLLNFIYNNYFADDNNGLALSAIQLYVNGSPDPAIYNNITTLIVGDDIIDVNNGSLSETFYQDNLGQFVEFTETHSNIDIEKATQILDTNIYELYPSELTKQQRINRFFQEYINLTPPETPRQAEAITDEGGIDGLTDTENLDTMDVYHHHYDISFAPIDDREDKYITWRDAKADSENTGKTLQFLYDDLQRNYFLEEDLDPGIADERPKYRSRSSGYLKVRTLNQAIVVRNEESSDIGLIGSDENEPTWETEGFTITMWMRFLDKVNGGTLFNFGNPLREIDPTGFMLETFVVERKFGTGQPGEFFVTGDVERFVRLVVRDEGGFIRDSHVGNTWAERIDTVGFNTQAELDAPYNSGDPSAGGVSPFNYTQIPIDLREWYFIVATYDPNIQEDVSISTYLDADDFGPDGATALKNDPDFWRWNIEPTEPAYTSYSEHGAMCKVEIISRTDLLRARGFQT
ncbi:MAG: hypothetical protein CMB80_05300 [Flammeovirgaceae bacterium]|nr:hypothetical protein [Flammeovirgaceae bacterium]